jgi:uncharacterized membrane protein
VAEVAGQLREWDAEITEQHPDERIAWTSTSGQRNAGVVTFHRLADDRTKVMLQVDHDPEGLLDKAGDALGLVRRQTKADLTRFKELIEARGEASGGWRGDVSRN